MIKVINLMSYWTLLYIIALVDCAESSRWSFVSLPACLPAWSSLRERNVKEAFV
jgi:hypothetical protein